MANISWAGLNPIANDDGETVQLHRRRVASNNGTAMFWGDAMKRTAAGVWGLATAGAGLSGVAQGASFFDSTINGRREGKFLPVSTTYTGTAFDDYGNTDESFVYITADPVGNRFLAQYSAATPLPANADLTLNANFVATAGSTVTGQSGHALDNSTLATTLTLDLTVIDMWRNVANDPTLVNAKVIVQINNGRVPPFGTAAPGSVGV